MELKHLNLVDETNVQMALCPKDTSFYIIITSDVQWVQKNLIIQKNSNRLCTQLNDAKFQRHKPFIRQHERHILWQHNRQVVVLTKIAG